MARGRRSAGPEVSLFPFLSILACLIGALTMLIVALSLMEILQGREDDSVARAEDYVALEREVAASEQEILRLEEENVAAAELAEVAPKVARLRVEVERLEKTAANHEALDKRAEGLADKKQSLLRDQQALGKDLVEGREKLGVMARQKDKGNPIEILPAINFFRKVSPTFVEARANEVVVHTPTRKVPIKRAALVNDEAFKQVIDHVNKKEERIIVFLVRQDGRVTYHTARNVARQGGAVTSKLPLVGQGDINLRQFFGKKQPNKVPPPNEGAEAKQGRRNPDQEAARKPA